MKLRSLQIKGFKSFANDTVIHFNDEIIGIVGPNGSGKSNIVDSIRWALGEQKSKELRLEKMVDVIFNGSKSKKKAHMAQVSLTFENSKKLIPLDYEEIKISRILYASNESEYRINDVPCRLKDIRDLFLDTGIGSNSYAIIELGMVDDILSDKDNARRKMFEQAAGISKYKTRKRETLLKLKNTQLDLDRVEDILFELTVNLKKFEKQAKRTKRYYELKELYKELSIQKVIMSQKDTLETEKDLSDKLNNLEQKYNNNSTKIHTLEAEIQEFKKANLDSEQLLSEKQKHFNEIIDKVRNTESQREITKQSQTFTQQNLAREEKTNTSLKQSLTDLVSDLNHKDQKLTELAQSGYNIKKNFDQWATQFEDIEEKRKQVQGTNDSELVELRNIEERKFQIEKSIIEINSRSENLNFNKQNFTNEKDQFIVEKTGLTEQIANTKAELDKVTNELETALYQKEEQTKSIKEKTRLIDQEKIKLAAISRNKDAASNELNLLSDMLNNLEGFPESSKFLMKEWLAPKPLLSDIFSCQEKYRSTIESFLEPYLNYFVLEDFNEANKAIQLLKSAQKGKSKFFIISSFEHERRDEILMDQLGIPALSVIETETKYTPILAYLLGKVVILDDEKVMTEKLIDDETIYLSTSGSTRRAKHSVAGGSLGLFDGKRIGRKQEVQKLEKRVGRLTQEELDIANNITSINKELDQLTKDNLDEQIDAKKSLRGQLDIKLAQYQANIDTYNKALGQIEEKLIQLDTDNSVFIRQLPTLRVSLTDLEAAISNKKNLISEQSGQIEEIAQKFSDISTQYNKAQLDWVQHQNRKENLENEIAFKRKQLEELREKIKLSEQEISILRQQIEDNKTKLEQIKNELIRAYEHRDNAQKDLSETEQNFFSKKTIITNKEEELKTLAKSTQEIQLQITDVKEKVTSISYDMRSSMERLMIEFNVDINTVNPEEVLSSIDDSTVLMEKYEKIRNRVTNYGEINPMAVDAYDEIQERFTDLDTQKNDIIQAKDSLIQTIKEIDIDATERFKEAFYKAKDNFKEVFRSLFSDEDDCDLILLDSADPLNSNIEIVAKPKGKRPKVLSQLSGGEKTLTATALLFSLYLLKPAPFCIFDEVDAPLDDNNIQKFSKLIKRFSDESQFIIITHNKSTMANVDLLYGVFMQEQGVSGITQVDFREYEHNPILQKVNLN